MSKITYKSFQKNEDEHLYADFLRRFLAWIVDQALIYFLSWLLFIFVFMIINYFLLHLIAYIMGFFYFWVLETYNKGQTLGKLILQIKTVDEETKEVATAIDNLYNCLLKCNWITCIFDFIIGILKNYGDLKRKIRIMQTYSKTIVITKSQ